MEKLPESSPSLMKAPLRHLQIAETEVALECVNVDSALQIENPLQSIRFDREVFGNL